MPVAASPNPNFTSQAAVEAWLSAVGVNLRIDHAPNEAMLLAMESATADVQVYLYQRYPIAAQLASSPFVRSVTTLRTVIYLCTFRNNPVPKQLSDMWESQKEILTSISMGKMNVPGISIGKAKLPQAVHVRTDLTQNPSTRVTRIGTTNNPTGYGRYMDWTEPPAG